MKAEFYQPMECPVCGKFYFSELQADDDIDQLQCAKCGWHYDYDQACDQDLKIGKNARSTNEYRQWYHLMLAEKPDYDYSEEHCPTEMPHPCPVCNAHVFRDRDSFDVCPVCGWTDDGLMEDEPKKWAGSSNDLCLNEFRARYLKNHGL